jgi:3-hydroxyacyl-CoA dehydrogenase
MRVVVVEADPAALEQGLGRIEKSLEKLGAKQVEKGQLSAEQARAQSSQVRGRIRGSLRQEDLADCDLVIEAAVENLDVKKDLFGKLGKICGRKTIFASNTSSFSIAEMGAASGRPANMVGLHFFNPVQLMRLVEVVRTDATSEETFSAAMSFGEACGKQPVACKDRPGFIVNRLLVPYMVQALLMLERGDATATDIDTAMQLGCGYPMGPITLTDYVGLDTTLAILQGWTQKYPGESSFAIPKILEQKVAQKKLGRKTGEGFYKWEGDKRA